MEQGVGRRRVGVGIAGGRGVDAPLHPAQTAGPGFSTTGIGERLHGIAGVDDVPGEQDQLMQLTEAQHAVAPYPGEAALAERVAAKWAGVGGGRRERGLVGRGGTGGPVALGDRPQVVVEAEGLGLGLSPLLGPEHGSGVELVEPGQDLESALVEHLAFKDAESGGLAGPGVRVVPQPAWTGRETTLWADEHWAPRQARVETVARCCTGEPGRHREPVAAASHRGARGRPHRPRTPTPEPSPDPSVSRPPHRFPTA